MSSHAIRGEAGAELDLGLQYQFGHGVPRDYIEAAKWYRRPRDRTNVVLPSGAELQRSERDGVRLINVDVARFFLYTAIFQKRSQKMQNKIMVSICCAVLNVGIGLFAAALVVGLAHSEDAGDSLRPYAVSVGGGHGVYLGKGIVITAAHVAGFPPQVEIAGAKVPTKAVKRGDLNDVDLTLLSIDEQLPAKLGLDHIQLCQKPPGTGEPVFVVLPEGATQTYVMSRALLPSNIPAKFQTAIRDFGPGNSGTGVFDAKEKCLLGIISRKISTIQVKQVNGQPVREPVDIAKYFVPASEIASFIPSDIRF